MRLLLTTLLFIRLAVSGVYSIDCSTNKCYGQPEGCDADENCRVVFEFDPEGNLDLYLHNFNAQQEYAAFPIGEKDNGTTTFFICLPRSQLRLQAAAKLGEPITVSDNQLARTVRKIGEDDFICSFSSFELPNDFKNQQKFFVSSGEFVDNLAIHEIEPLYSLNINNDSDEDADYEPIYTAPISGTIKRTAKLTNDVYTSEDSDRANEAIDVIENIAGKDDSGLEDIEMVVGKKRGGKKASSRQDEDDEDVDDEDLDTVTRRPTRGNRKSSTRTSNEDEDQNEDWEDEEKQSKSRRPTKTNRKSKSTHSSDEDEDEDWEAEAEQIEKKNKKQSRKTRHRYDEDDEEPRPTRENRRRYEEDVDEDELPRKRSKSRRHQEEQDEDDEEDEGFYDDEDDSAFANFDIFLCSSIIIVVFGFVF